MLRSGASIRFSRAEIERAAQYGIDLRRVKTRDDWVKANITLINTLASERFELLEKIARVAAARKGVKLPAKLTMVDEA